MFPDDDTVHRIFIAHPEGYLGCAPAEWLKSRSVRLQPWARLEGVRLEQGQPAANLQVTLAFSSQADRPLMEWEYPAYRATTGENGHFVFPQVPADRLEIVAWQKVTGPRGASFGSHVKSVLLQPGETS